MNLDQITPNELGSKTLPQLRDIAKELGIKSTSKYKKNELIELISENIKEDSKKQESTEIKVNKMSEKKIEKSENLENRSYVKSYEKRNADRNTENRYQRNENK